MSADSPKGWHRLGGDVDWETYDGLWYKRDRRYPKGRVFYCLRFENLWEATGSKNLSKYMASTYWADLNDVRKETIMGALDSCGYIQDEATGEIHCPATGDVIAKAGEEADLVILEALCGYGVDWDDRFTSDTYPARLRAQAARSCGG